MFRLLQVSSSLLLVFSAVFLRIHVSFQVISIFVTFYSLFFFSILVLFGLSWSQLVSFRLVQASASLSGSPPGVSRSFQAISGGQSKKEEVTKSYTFRFDDRRSL